ncbi:hypothetical protein [Streptomyces sp. NPDC052727]
MTTAADDRSSPPRTYCPCRGPGLQRRAEAALEGIAGGLPD